MHEDFELAPKAGNSRKITAIARWPVAVPERGVAKGDPFDLSTHHLWFTAKRNVNDPDASAVVFKQTAAGISVRAAPNSHIADVRIDPADTSGVATDRPVSLFAELQVRTSVGEVWTVSSGKLIVLPRVTEAT